MLTCARVHTTCGGTANVEGISYGLHFADLAGALGLVRPLKFRRRSEFVRWVWRTFGRVWLFLPYQRPESLLYFVLRRVPLPTAPRGDRAAHFRVSRLSCSMGRKDANRSVMRDAAACVDSHDRL